MYRILPEKTLPIWHENQLCNSRNFYVKKHSWKCHFSVVLFFCITTMYISSCSSDNDTTFPKITHLAFQTEKNGPWGMVGTDGKALFKDKIEYELGETPSCAINGIFRTCEFDNIQRIFRFKYYTATEEPQQIGLVGGYKEGGIYSEGIIPVVAHEGRIHYINNTGDTVFCLNPYNGKEFLSVCSYFTEQRAWFSTEDYKYGYIDPKGNVVIEPVYDGASPFHEGKALVYNREENKHIIIDTNGNELFEVGVYGTMLGSPIFYNGYCIIDNFLYNDKGERMERMSANASYISSFSDDVALFQDKKTKRWQQMDIHGNSIGNSQYDRVLGSIDDLLFVANTLSNSKKGKEEGDEDKYMNVYAIDKNGKVCNQIDNIFRFYPLYENAVMCESDRYYFTDKNGNPINNDSFHFIDIPAYINFPNCSTFLSYLYSSPHGGKDYDTSVRTSYFNEYRTVESILNQLTDSGIGKLKIGLTAIDLMTKFDANHVPTQGEYKLNYNIQGINGLLANCSVILMNEDIHAIEIQFEEFLLPSDKDISNRISNAIITYLDKLGLDKVEITAQKTVIYHADQRTYDILYLDSTLYLISKPMMSYMLNELLKS